VGIYLSEKPNRINGDDIGEVENLYGSNEATTKNKSNIDAANLNRELASFQSSLAEAVANNRLQEIIDGFYNANGTVGGGVEPPVYVIPTAPVMSNGGGNGNNPNNGSDENGNGAGTVGVGESNDEPTDSDSDGPYSSGNEGDDTGDENDTDNFQIGTGSDEFSTESDNGVMPGGDEGANESGGADGGSEGADNNNPAWLPEDPANTPSGGSALPANGISAVQNGKEPLKTGAIVGIALVAFAFVLVAIALCYLLRLRRKNEASRQSRGAIASNKSKKKSMASSMDEEDLVSNDSSNKDSLCRFLYSGVQDGNMLDTNHSRMTAPTVSASTSTMSDDHSASSTSVYGGRGTEDWKKDEVVVPMNTSRGLLVLESVEEETRPEEEQDDPNDPLLGFGALSDLYVPPVDGEVFEMEACIALSSSSSSSGGSIDENVEAYVVHSPALSGRSSRRSSNGSRSSSESPLKTMAARSLRALRPGRRNSNDRTRSIEKSKQDLESVLAGEGFKTNQEELQVIRLSDGASPSNASFPANARPLSSLDEAIMKGDWAAVGATAALMAASLSPEDKAKRAQTRRRPSLNSPPPEKAELDQLIEAGDWQAVMVAAAQYDASSQTESARSRTSTQGSDTIDGSYNSGAEYSSAYNSTTRGSVQTSASQKERIEEIRTQVEQLVRDVVPDETENVDEMMTQFNGKEEELLETLRTMKERDVAKKARMESQKIARRNTRSREKDDRFPQATEIDIVEDNTPSTLNQDPPAYDSGDDDSDFSPEPAAAPVGGSFDQVTKGCDSDAAAAAAAAWAIERSLSEQMKQEQAEPRFLV
jgi:hypothetical protein